MRQLIALWRTARIGEHALAQSVWPGLIGLVPPLVYLAVADGGAVLARLAVALAATLAWQVLFSRVRRRAMGLDGFLTAALVALFTPAEAPFWQLLLGTSFGVVLGEQVFGGRGRNFVNPAVVALAFVMFSFTGIDYRSGPELPALTLLPALVLLVGSGQASWRILATAAAALVLVAWAEGAAVPWAGLLSGSILAVLLYLAADPVASAATNWGRLAHGALVGVLAGLFAQAGPAFGAAVFAVLMASIFAPLIDQGVVALHMRWREGRRHG